MKKNIVLTSMLSLLGITAFAQKATDDFSGKWKTPEGKTVVITKTTTGFVGMAVDKKAIVLKDLKFTDGEWKATIVKPADNTKIKCELVLSGNNLNITAHKAFFSKKIVWVKE